MTAPIPRWIKLADAREITGHANNDTLSDWCRRWNAKHPNCQVQRAHGFIEQRSLEAAWRQRSQELSREERVSVAVASLHKRGARILSVRGRVRA